MKRAATATARVLGVGAALALAACASTPPVHYYTLVAADPPAARTDAPTDRGPVLLLEPVRVPPQVEQPQWLVRLPDDTLVLLEQERWTSPLPDELHQALTEILTLRFGAVDARSPGAAPARWRVRVELLRFDSRPGESRLEGTWALAPAGSPNESPPAPAAGATSSPSPPAAAAATAAPPAAGGWRCAFVLREPVAGGMAALAEAHRRNVARLGEAVGEAVLAASRGQAVACPR